MWFANLNNVNFVSIYTYVHICIIYHNTTKKKKKKYTDDVDVDGGGVSTTVIIGRETKTRIKELGLKAKR